MYTRFEAALQSRRSLRKIEDMGKTQRYRARVSSSFEKHSSALLFTITRPNDKLNPQLHPEHLQAWITYHSHGKSFQEKRCHSRVT